MPFLLLCHPFLSSWDEFLILLILLSTQEHGSAGNWAPLRAGVHSGASCFRQLITDTGDVSSWTVSAGAQAGVWDGPLVSQQGRGGGLSSQSGHKGPSRDQSCLRELTSLRRRTAPTLSSGISGPKAAESVMLKFPLLTTWSSIRDRGWALWGPCPTCPPHSGNWMDRQPVGIVFLSPTSFLRWTVMQNYAPLFSIWPIRHFLGGPVVETLPSKAGGAGTTPGQVAASWPKKPKYKTEAIL